MNFLKNKAGKLFLIAAAVILFIAAQLINENNKRTDSAGTDTYNIPDSQFIIGAFNNAKDINYEYQERLSFNTWHEYTGPYGGWQNDGNDHFDKDVSSYTNTVQKVIAQNSKRRMRTIMNRPITEYLISGQRIDYQCESIPADFKASDYWFYAYNNSVSKSGGTDYSITDIRDEEYGAESTVKYCDRKGSFNDNAILINSGMRANREFTYMQTNAWMKDNAYKWYVMPRIRIDKEFASDARNDTVTVCRVVLHGWNGQAFKEITLRVMNFKENGTYDGGYKEVYNFSGQQVRAEISTGEVDSYLVHPGGQTFYWEGEKNETDIKVYWTGKCSAWFDRVRVENQPAHEYLTLKDKRWIDKVDEEVRLALMDYDANYPVPNYFYFEECQMSHFPVIKELNRQITETSKRKTELVIWLNYDLFKLHIPQSWKYNLDADLLKRYLYDDYGLRTIVMGAYSLEGWADKDGVDKHRSSFHPTTLSASGYNKLAGILSEPKPPAEYDTWLQEHFDDSEHLSGVNYSYISKLMYGLSKKGMRIINCPQAHLWHQGGHKLKEPSNEELELQANLALTYNARGIWWFAYMADPTNFKDDYFCRGIMEYERHGAIPTPRVSNVYGQDKFKAVCEIDALLKKRSEYVMRFNPTNTKTCTYSLSGERNTFLLETFFSDIITYKTGDRNCSGDNPGGSNPQGMVYECNADRYLQAAVFKANGDDVTKYFMIVNRRCSPYIDNSSEEKTGGMRFIRIKFDTDPKEFAGSDKWRIINIDNGNVVAKFIKNSGTLIDLGFYRPGMGVMYKIEAVK